MNLAFCQSCGLLAEDWPQSFEQYTQNGQYFRQNVMIWLFKKYFGLFRLHSYLSAAPSVKQGHVFFIYSRPYLRLGAHNSGLYKINFICFLATFCNNKVPNMETQGGFPMENKTEIRYLI